MCKNSKCEFFTSYAEYVYGLKFEEEPNYNYLRFILTKNLMNIDLFPDKNFDWINKINQGKFNKFDDQYLNILSSRQKNEKKPMKVKLSKRIKELNFDNSFLVNHEFIVGGGSSRSEEVKK